MRVEVVVIFCNPRIITISICRRDNANQTKLAERNRDRDREKEKDEGKVKRDLTSRKRRKNMAGNGREWNENMKGGRRIAREREQSNKHPKN